MDPVRLLRTLDKLAEFYKQKVNIHHSIPYKASADVQSDSLADLGLQLRLDQLSTGKSIAL